MIYKVGESLEEISVSDISDSVLTVGVISSEELETAGPSLGFDPDTIESGRRINMRFRTGVDVRETYTFAELRLMDSSDNDDFISIFLKQNLLLVVEIQDDDHSAAKCLMDSLKKQLSGKKTLEKLVCFFVEDLFKNGNVLMETLQDELCGLEETIISGTAEKELNESLLQIKKRLRKYSGIYGQMQDVFETFENNDNNIFDDSNLIYISNMINKLGRSRDEISSLNGFADHLQDAYASMMDQKLNNTMKRITVITTIFFPLTIIVGWYGMNFKNMPELEWEYGYILVILISAIVIAILLIIGKKRKWF
ncbi:MAG: CorA family divalent cation transporter [Lachnospiraceae bacterium]|nr:CorA family divalent cation transporter [Lachnospiraceae bacterium]